MTRSVVFVAVLVVLLLTVGAAPAVADPARPTNYESVVITVEPSTEGVRFEVVGGDAFLTVSAGRGHEVLVPGYFNEPYLRIDADGSVFINENSPAFFINDDRYGQVPIPETVDATADPVWMLVSSDGRYAWHDHRAHWMSEDRPPAVAGDKRQQVFEWEIPVEVDGRNVTVSGELLWLPSRSPLPALMAGVITLLPLLWWRPGRTRLLATVTLGASVVATAVTVAQSAGTPSSVSGVPMMIVFPLLAALFSVASLVAFGQSPILSRRLVLLGGVVLTSWVLSTIDVLWLPVLPSTLSPVGERAAVAVVLWAAVGAVVLALADELPFVAGATRQRTSQSEVSPAS